MTLTKEEAASALNGSEYGEEGNKELFAMMKENGLVAVFGASDDLMEFRGAIYDEVGCYGGGKAYLTDSGMLTHLCEDESCPHEEQRRQYATTIEAVWGDADADWTYKTVIPHATFRVTDDDIPYCRGIVFALTDVPA